MGRRNEEASLVPVWIEPKGPSCVPTFNLINMLRTTHLALALAIIGNAVAQLEPGTLATTGTHLLEVNDQWKAMDPTVCDDQHLVHFTSGTDRIAAHLHAVGARLSARTPRMFPPAALHQRHALLDTLNAYADRGRFPMNTALPGRSPVFIDDAGTACAVGQLMIASGHADLAQRIHEQMNLAYIRDIALPEVAAWASTNGFTTDELAWIQPTYEHMKHRDPQVIASLQMANGDQVRVQRPLNATDTPKLNLVRKDAGGETVLAHLPMLSGMQVAEYNGHVFIGGMPPKDTPTAEVYEWNGSALVKHDPFPGRTAIGSLHLVNGMLHVLGYEPGNGQPQERYLTASGEWKAAPISAEPIKEEVPRMDVVPE
jgi:hypothetical protein